MVGVAGDMGQRLPSGPSRYRAQCMVDDPTHTAFQELLRSLRAHLEWQRACGAPWLPRSSGSVRPAAEPAGSVRPPAAVSAAQAPAWPARSAAAADLFAEPGVREAQTLAALAAHIGDCQRCKLARLGRTTVVFGVGNPDADLMFVGEGPGADEDRQGEPFVGRAGQLLTEIITKGMKLRRQDVYIANVIKCRPPGNRNPEPDEIATCMPFLVRQIDLVRPRVIVALGTFAAQTLLGVKTPITRMRGNWHEYRDVPVMPTFHPAYLLRNPADKRVVWEDIKLVMGALGMPV
jgi:uracil-DNA glycosylase